MLRQRLRQYVGAQVQGVGGQRLVAVVVCGNGGRIDAGALREYCNERLPPYMVPQLFCGIAAMPKTPTGKIDRKTLQQRSWSTSPVETANRAESLTEMEHKLSAIWAEVLGFDAIAADDNFFEVGGDSLLSIRILAKAARQGMSVRPEEFFANPTIAEQAALVEAALTAGHDQDPSSAAFKPSGQPVTILDQADIAQVARLLGDIDSQDESNN